MPVETAKKVFTQADVEYAIQKSAEHCAWIMNHNQGSIYVEGEWTAQYLIKRLREGMGTNITQKGSSFSSRGTANSLSLRLQGLKDAINGCPSRSWLHYWTKR